MKTKLNQIGKTIIILLIIAVISVGTASFLYSYSALGPARELYFKNNEFKVLQLTDFHEWLAIETPKEVIEQTELKPGLIAQLDTMLDYEKPDFVVLTGDNTFPLSWLAEHTLSITSKTYVKIAEYMESRKQYWTLTFGNHDTESMISKDIMLSKVENFSYFIGGTALSGDSYNAAIFKDNKEAGETDSYGNFSIPIYSRQFSNKVAYNIMTLDCRSYFSPGHLYLNISNEQTDFYVTQSNLLKGAPTLLFTHIVLKEVVEQYQLAISNNATIYGYNNGMSPSTLDTSLWEKMHELKNVKGFFFGHDHNTSITFKYEVDDWKMLVGITPSAQMDSYDDLESIVH